MLFLYYIRKANIRNVVKVLIPNLFQFFIQRQPNILRTIFIKIVFYCTNKIILYLSYMFLNNTLYLYETRHINQHTSWFSTMSS